MVAVGLLRHCPPQPLRGAVKAGDSLPRGPAARTAQGGGGAAKGKGGSEGEAAKPAAAAAAPKAAAPKEAAPGQDAADAVLLAMAKLLGAGAGKGAGGGGGGGGRARDGEGGGGGGAAAPLPPLTAPAGGLLIPALLTNGARLADPQAWIKVAPSSRFKRPCRYCGKNCSEGYNVTRLHAGYYKLLEKDATVEQHYAHVKSQMSA